ncbi:hypothetical protein R6Z07M_014466 [Ovis aries]
MDFSLSQLSLVDVGSSAAVTPKVMAGLLTGDKTVSAPGGLSACAPHLTAVAIFRGTGIFVCLQPSSSHSLGSDQVASVFHATAIPVLNPLAYGLRIKVKSAFKTAVGKAKSSMGSVF